MSVKEHLAFETLECEHCGEPILQGEVYYFDSLGMISCNNCHEVIDIEEESIFAGYKDFN